MSSKHVNMKYPARNTPLPDLTLHAALGMPEEPSFPIKGIILTVLLSVIGLALIVSLALWAESMKPDTGYGTPCYNHCTLTGYEGLIPQYDCAIPCNKP